MSRQLTDAAMEQVAEQMARLRERDPGAWAGYLDEGQCWEAGTTQRLDS